MCTVCVFGRGGICSSERRRKTVLLEKCIWKVMNTFEHKCTAILCLFFLVSWTEKYVLKFEHIQTHAQWVCSTKVWKTKKREGWGFDMGADASLYWHMYTWGGHLGTPLVVWACTIERVHVNVLCAFLALVVFFRRAVSRSWKTGEGGGKKKRCK